MAELLSLSPTHFHHLSVANVTRPMPWRFALPPIVERDPRSPTFRRFRSASTVCPSEDHVSGWLDAASAAYDRIQDATPSGAFTAAMKDTDLQHWKRLTVQLGTTIPWFVSAIGPGDVELKLSNPDLFHAIGDRLVEVYRAARDDSYPEYSRVNPEPADTNGGWPSFMSGPAAKIFGALFIPQGTNFLEAFDNASQFCQLVGLDPATALGYGLGSRTGPMYKWQPMARFDFDARTWTAGKEWRGYAERNRIVQMSSVAFNYVLRELTAALKLTRANIPGLWRRGRSDAFLANAFPFRAEADISGYDVSVPAALQRNTGALWKRIWPELAEHVSYWLACERAPLLTPSWDLRPEYLSVLTALGGTRTGLKNTAEIGTFIGLHVTLYALGLQGFDVLHWPEASDFANVHQGDDVLVSTNRPIDREAWASAFLECNLKCEAIEGDGFLSRHLPGGGRSLPIAGRIVQQTMSNENEQPGNRLKGLQYLGFAARADGAQDLPTFLQEQIWSCIKHAEWIRETGATSLKEVLHFVNGPDARGAIVRALEVSAGLDWLATETRSIEYNFSAQKIAELALELGLQPELVASRDRVTDEIIRATRNMAPRDKLRIATEAWAAALSGPASLDRWVMAFAKDEHGELRSRVEELEDVIVND